MNESERMNRRRFLKWSTAGGLGIAAGLLALDPNKDVKLAELEKLALKTQEGRIFGFYDYEGSLSDLKQYELHFRSCTGGAFTYERYLERVKKRFPNDKHLLVADIGGSDGTAASGLNDIEGVEAFVIDPENSLPISGKGLPKERYIIREIEYTGLPDNTFHFMTSYNTYHHTKLPRSFTEVHRLLRRGGVAILHHEHWWQPGVLEQMEELEIKDDIRVVMSTLNGIWEGEKGEILTLDQFNNVIRDVSKGYGKDGLEYIAPFIKPYFTIIKTK